MTSSTTAADAERHLKTLIRSCVLLPSDASAIWDAVIAYVRASQEPPAPADPDVFTLGKSLLTAQGVSVKDAGSLLGRLRRDHGDAAVMQALQFAEEKRPSELRAWLVKTVPAMASGTSKRNGVHIGQQDYAAGWGGAADADF